MRAGELIHQIQLQAPAPTTNDFGETVPGYTTAFTVWASAREMRGPERTRNGLTETGRYFVFRMRSLPDDGGRQPNDSWQLVHDGRTLAIQSVTEVERKAVVEIVAHDKGAL